MVQGSSLIRPRTVTGDGAGMVSHAGIAWLAETADLAGLTAGLSTAMAQVPQRRHDPGRTLAQMVLALADGATCLSPAYTPAAMTEAVRRALALPADDFDAIRRAAAATAAGHSLAAERERFHSILYDVDRLWAPDVPRRKG